MADKKYQIFVSSTFRDLIDERQDAIRNILDLNHIPAGMELFPAADIEQLEYIKKVIDECDYYLLIVGGRYGSMDAEGVSYTEREYDYAVQTGKVVIAFVHEDPEQISVAKSDIRPEVTAALNAFREKVMQGRLVKGWSNRQNLEPVVLKSLIHAFNSMPQIGWIRANLGPSDKMIEQSNALLQDNAALKEQVRILQMARQPALENIAGLDDSITIRYRIRWYHGGSYRHQDHTAELTWKQIFLGLAGQLDRPKTNGAIESGFKEALKQAGIDLVPYDIDHTDSVKIKLQMIALGLISAQVANVVGGGQAEFLSLTPSGQKQLMELMVAKKD
jgi:hypothetical protein